MEYATRNPDTLLQIRKKIENLGNQFNVVIGHDFLVGEIANGVSFYGIQKYSPVRAFTLIGESEDIESVFTALRFTQRDKQKNDVMKSRIEIADFEREEQEELDYDNSSSDEELSLNNPTAGVINRIYQSTAESVTTITRECSDHPLQEELDYDDSSSDGELPPNNPPAGVINRIYQSTAESVTTITRECSDHPLMALSAVVTIATMGSLWISNFWVQETQSL